MSAIKEAIDLLISLSNRVQDRQTATEILKVQSLISTVQLDNAALISENLDLKKKLTEQEISSLKKISRLESENAELRKKNADLQKDDGGGFASGVIVSSHFDR